MSYVRLILLHMIPWFCPVTGFFLSPQVSLTAKKYYYHCSENCDIDFCQVGVRKVGLPQRSWVMVIRWEANIQKLKTDEACGRNPKDFPWLFHGFSFQLFTKKWWGSIGVPWVFLSIVYKKMMGFHRCSMGFPFNCLQKNDGVP